MLLAVIGLLVSILLGAPGPSVLSAQAASPRSQLPVTQLGLSRNEGVFLVTAADDGSRLVYFIAQNTRHSTLPSDLVLEQQLNSLWPVRLASREEVLAFPEADPVGRARSGLLSATIAVEAAEPDATAAVAEAPDLAEAPAVANAPVAAALPSAAETDVYLLQRGDNLTRISARYNTTVEALLAANGLTNADRIYFGQPLVIPGTASATDQVLAHPEPAQAPPATTPDVGDSPAPAADVPATPTAEAATYTVKTGDSAIHIARQFGVAVDALLAANGVTNPNRVYVGQVLDIPSDDTGAGSRG